MRVEGGIVDDYFRSQLQLFNFATLSLHRSKDLNETTNSGNPHLLTRDLQDSFTASIGSRSFLKSTPELQNLVEDLHVPPIHVPAHPGLERGLLQQNPHAIQN